MRFSHTLSTCKHYVYSSIIVLAMTLFLAGCPSPNDTTPPKNDLNPLLTITATQASVTEGATSTFTITRNNNEGALSVLLNISGSAEHNVDYTVDPTVDTDSSTDSSTGNKTMTVDFEDSNKSVTFTITAKNDEVPDNGEEVVITIKESGDYTIGDPYTATLTIVDPLPVVSISTSGENNVNEGENISVTITSNQLVTADLNVSLTIAGTATINEDYALPGVTTNTLGGTVTATVTIPRGRDTLTFTITGIDDGDVEGNEEVIITISEMPSAYTIDEGNNEVIITIVDDDDTDGDMIPNSEDVDDDNNGLIEIHNLEMLRNVHFNLAGTSYDDEEDDAGTGATGSTNGGPASPTDHCSTLVNGVYLCGYELMRDLNFNDAKSYVAESIHPPWQPDGENHQTATNEGFPGIGAEIIGAEIIGAKIGDSGGFTGIFEGNGYSISNLYMRNTTTTGNYNTGLFRLTEAGAKIRNLGMTNVALYGGDRNDRVGGLVGYNFGDITASYATGDVDGGAGGFDFVGGLVGYNNGTITASYATGDVDGGAENLDTVGGLAGGNSAAITASYATGTVDGGAGNYDFVGGLVGINDEGDITASYATGDVDGGAGNSDEVGGLVGLNSNNGTITASYGFGTPSGETVNSDGADKPNNVTMASDLTKDNAGSEWNDAVSNTLGAWDFGDTSQNPALKYADYDGDAGSVYSCGPVPTCGSFLPEQGR